MQPSAPQLRNAAALLTSANAACAIIGASQGFIVLRLLGAEYYGAAAVLAALTAVAANLVDARLTDLISKLYYDGERAGADGTHHRAAVIRLGLGLYAVCALLITVIALGLVWIGAPRLTGVELSASWLWMAAIAQGVSYLGSFFIFVQRFIARPRQMAHAQLASAVIHATAMLASVWGDRTVGGYATGLLASAAGVMVLNAWQTFVCLAQGGISLREKTSVPVEIDRRVVLRFLAAGNVLGYVKLLHRSADVLLVAAMCGDRVTAVYKLARSIGDTLLVVPEAIGRVYQPQLLSLLQVRNHIEFRAIVSSIMTAAAAITAAALAVEVAVLPRIAPILGIAESQDLTLSVAILTLSFFFVAGLQSWIVPVFVFSGRPGRCTLWCAIGVIGAQYGIGPAFAYLTGHASAAWFCLGYLGYYAMSLLPLWNELRIDQPTLAWRPRQLAA